MAVHLLGCPADMDALMALAARARPRGHRGRRAGARAGRSAAALFGTIGDVGVFSLNYHKTIHSGEGGVAVTRDARLAERLRLSATTARS